MAVTASSAAGAAAPAQRHGQGQSSAETCKSALLLGVTAAAAASAAGAVAYLYLSRTMPPLQRRRSDAASGSLTQHRRGPSAGSEPAALAQGSATSAKSAPEEHRHLPASRRASTLADAARFADASSVAARSEASLAQQGRISSPFQQQSTAAHAAAAAAGEHSSRGPQQQQQQSGFQGGGSAAATAVANNPDYRSQRSDMSSLRSSSSAPDILSGRSVVCAVDCLLVLRCLVLPAACTCPGSWLGQLVHCIRSYCAAWLNTCPPCSLRQAPGAATALAAKVQRSQSWSDVEAAFPIVPPGAVRIEDIEVTCTPAQCSENGFELCPVMFV